MFKVVHEVDFLLADLSLKNLLCLLKKTSCRHRGHHFGVMFGQKAIPVFFNINVKLSELSLTLLPLFVIGGSVACVNGGLGP